MTIRLIAVVILVLAIVAGVLALHSAFIATDEPSKSASATAGPVSTGSAAAALSPEEKILKNLRELAETSEYFNNPEVRDRKREEYFRRIVNFGSVSVEVLDNALSGDLDTRTRSEALNALERLRKALGGREPFAGIYRRIAENRSEPFILRLQAIQLYAKTMGADAFEFLESLWSEPDLDYSVRAKILQLIGAMKTEGAFLFLAGVYNDPQWDENIKKQALMGMANTGSELAVDIVLDALKNHESRAMRKHAAIAAQNFKRSQLPALKKALAEETDESVKTKLRGIIRFIEFTDRD